MARKVFKKDDFPLGSHVDDLMGKLREHVPAALATFDADEIHDARVSTRRLAAALELLKPVLTKKHRKPLAGGLKRLRRRLGPLRDADVLIEHLSDLRKEAKHATAAEWLICRVEEDRQSLRKESQKRSTAERELDRLDVWPIVREEMKEAGEAVDLLLAESLHVQTDAFAEQADRVPAEVAGPGKAAVHSERAPVIPEADESATDFPDADADISPPDPSPPHVRPNPHDVRIAGKALRYTLEMAIAEGHTPGAGLMKTFKRMQDLLGSWHDYVVLADRAMSEVVEAELTHFDAAASEGVIELAKFAVKQSTQNLAAFRKLWRQQGAKITAKIRASFPLTKPLMAAGEEAAREPSGSAAGPDGQPDVDLQTPTERAHRENSGFLPGVSEEDGAAETSTESRTDPDPSDSE
jgi:CHAD domain-containing protein